VGPAGVGIGVAVGAAVAAGDGAAADGEVAASLELGEPKPVTGEGGALATAVRPTAQARTPTSAVAAATIRRRGRRAGRGSVGRAMMGGR
jgi:hypothetical protein